MRCIVSAAFSRQSGVVFYRDVRANAKGDSCFCYETLRKNGGNERYKLYYYVTVIKKDYHQDYVL